VPLPTSAGRLLDELQRESPSVRDMVVAAAGVSADRAEGSINGTTRLSLSEQLRLSEATILLAPSHARAAVRMRAQVLAARSFENRELVDRHADAPDERWERAPHLRR
jgi:hypothetical protein